MDKLYAQIPVGVGTTSPYKVGQPNFVRVLNEGMDLALERGYARLEDLECCEENGRMATADATAVSSRAFKRGRTKLGTMGGGNQYVELQVVNTIYDPEAAAVMGIQSTGQVCVMFHTGSRGLGHPVATDALEIRARDGICANDKQLASCFNSITRGAVLY